MLQGTRFNRRWIEVGVSIAIGLLILVLLLPAVQQAREAARRTATKNQLRQIGLAIGNYSESYQMLPHGGVFREDGTPLQSWDTALLLYLSQRAPIDAPDSRFPWDDPVNVDHFMRERTEPWQVQGLTPTRSPDGLPLTHLAGNQSLFYRNSVVHLDRLPEISGTVLIGQAYAKFVPIGYPYNWRDLTLGMGTSDDGFGCRLGRATMFVMGDLSVKEFSNNTHPDVLRALAGPIPPRLREIAKPKDPYRLAIRDYWRYLFVVRGHKKLMTLRLSPDRKSLDIDFGSDDNAEEAIPEHWNPYFQKFIQGAQVEHVQICGDLLARELQPLLELQTLKKLTISDANIKGDVDQFLAPVRSRLQID